VPPSTELRQDPSTRNWVVVAPERSRRPDVFRRTGERPARAGACPLCPGREAETPAETWRLSGPNGEWRVRVVPNKFPALADDGGARRRVSAEGFVTMAGIGRHEVIIESRDHTGDLALADDAAVRAVLEAYRARYRALRAGGTAVIITFRNHGPAAGTSLDHPHSQIVAAPVVPLEIRHRFDVAMQHYDDLGTCLYVDILERELRDGRRIVLEDPKFVAFQPFASASPFETWIMPRFHQPSFGDATDDTLDGLAPVLRRVLGGLSRELGDPDYNYVVDSAPPGDEGREYFVWHVRIVPRLSTPAGFELGSGMRINPSPPEDTAAALRRAVESEIPAGQPFGPEGRG
jgi:UDPglucose--hexose-1-phosphate uridylyltransferase